MKKFNREYKQNKNMKLKNVLISTKQTAYEYYKSEYDDLKEVLSPEDLKIIKKNHESHYKALNNIKKILDSKKINHQRVYMPYAAFEEFKGRDLIIAFGGDGTVLNTAHYILDDTPILTVKSEKASVGALCTIDTYEFEYALKKILSGKFKTELWIRAEIKFGNRVDFALNDILVGPKYRPQVARYEIDFKGKEEKQMSSGLIISTGAGSTGWYSNIAGNDGKFSRTAKYLKFIVTECKSDDKYKLIKGKIMPGEIFRVKSLMNIDGITCFDGDTKKRMHNFYRGKSIQVRISDKPLKVIIT